MGYASFAPCTVLTQDRDLSFAGQSAIAEKIYLAYDSLSRYNIRTEH